MILLSSKDTKSVMIEIASRVKLRRLELNLTQDGLSKRAGIKLPTYRKFEQTGIIALGKLLNIAFALNCLEDFDALFTQKRYMSIDDVINEDKVRKRKRGKNDSPKKI